MKTTLLLAILISGFAWAAKKDPDLKRNRKAVDEKLLKSVSNEESQQKTIQSKVEQLEAKKSRQFQEENLYERSRTSDD